MAGRMRALVSLARAAAVTAAAMSVCAFPAGPASAAASARPDGGGVVSISCTSAGDCGAVGFLDFRGVTQPLVVSEKGGAWGGAGTVPGLSALPGGDRSAELGIVSCSSAGNCSAGGCYQVAGCPDNLPSQALVVTERNGVWGRARAVPGLAALNTGRDASVDLMSCRTAGSCTAAGTYPGTRNPDESAQVFVVSEKNGTWGRARPVPGLAAIDHDMANDNALSCGSPGNCAIAGWYDNRAGYPEPYVASQKNGVWGRVRTFPAIAAVATQGAGIDTLSCRPRGDCTGTGTWYDAGGTPHVFAISQTHGTWGAARPIPGFPALPRGRVSLAAGISLSCPSARNCTLGGDYISNGDGDQLFVVTEKNGTWGRARALPGVAALSNVKMNLLTAIACFTGGNCTAVGEYSIRRKSGFTNTVFVTSEKNGTWGKPERMPGSAALGTNVAPETLSCGATGDCSAGGIYSSRHGDQPFLATEENGTWGNAEPVLAIQP